MTGSPPLHPAIRAFTVRYCARKMGKEAIRAWIAKAKKTRRLNSIRTSLNADIAAAEAALIDLKPIKTHPNVELARQNAQAHLEWAKATKAELLRMYPNARSQYRPQHRPRRPNRMRVGLLGRAVQVFKDRKPVDED